MAPSPATTFKQFLKALALTTLFATSFLLISSVSNDTVRTEGGDTYLKTMERKVKDLQSRLNELMEKSGAPHLSAFSQAGETCKVRKKVAFAKTHKTGSSTLQNIFFRFGIEHNLTFAMPPKSWMFSFKEPFDASVVLDGPWRGMDFDMFIFHSIWNYPEVKRVLPGAKYVTLLRDPVDCFESNYVYMGLEKAFKMDINEFAQKKAAKGMLRRPNAIIGKDQMLWDLGMPTKDLENVTLVKRKIEELDSQFDLVMVTEMFPESLVLLHDLLCWPMKEMTSLKQNERVPSKKSRISPETRKIMKDWLWADYMLYEHFLVKLKSRLLEYGEDLMIEKKAELQLLNEKIRVECVKEKANNDRLKGEFKMALNIVLGYVIDETKPWCALYARSEPNFTKQINDFQSMKHSELKLRGRL